MLPISEKDKRFLGEDPDWQTKDFDCILSTVEITKEDNLRFRQISYGWNKNAINGLGTKGCLTEENVEWVDLKNYHGFVNFYTHDKNQNWWEFSAKFTDGKLVSIEGGKEKEAAK